LDVCPFAFWGSLGRLVGNDEGVVDGLAFESGHGVDVYGADGVPGLYGAEDGNQGGVCD